MKIRVKKKLSLSARICRFILKSPQSTIGCMFGTTFVTCYLVFYYNFMVMNNNTNNNNKHRVDDTHIEQQNKKLRSSFQGGGQEYIQQQLIVPDSDMECQTVFDKIKSGEWLDPNDGKVHSRETTTFPRFQISLHNEEYDPVRWNTIMKEGTYYETEVQDRFIEILGDGKAKIPSDVIVLDVGANIGYYTLLSASLGYNVLSFEPNPTNIMRLCQSIDLNSKGFDSKNAQVHIFQNAVSDTHGTEMILRAVKNPGQAFLSKPEGDQDMTNFKQDTHNAKTTTVTIDEFARNQGWFYPIPNKFKVKLFKIDVEGKEPAIIQGSKFVLSSGIVENILTEGRRFGRDTIRDSFAVLFETGYTLKFPYIQELFTTPGVKEGPKEKAQIVCDYFLKTLKRKMAVVDLWWVRKEAFDGSNYDKGSTTRDKLAVK